MHIVTLTAADAPRYRELMLEAYELAADAFTSTAQERAREPVEWWAQRIADPTGLSASFAAESNGELLGTVTLEYNAKPKTLHEALIIGMYVRAAVRGQGLGAALLAAAISHAQKRPGLRQLTLTVTEGNTSAIQLYESAGFVAWGIKPMAILTPSGYRGKVHMSRTLTSLAP